MSSKFLRDDLEKFMEYNIYLPTRTIYLGSQDYDFDGNESGTDFKMAASLIKLLHILDEKVDSPINIIMNNLGGDEYSGLAIYDAIKNCKNTTTIRVYGCAMSMGAWILQSANKRIMSPNSYLMIHYGNSSVSDHTKNFQKWAEQSKKT